MTRIERRLRRQRRAHRLALRATQRLKTSFSFFMCLQILEAIDGHRTITAAMERVLREAMI